eukprot:CAMPEP_0195318316 /NCGR_PEP_ID=MMETSP0708-20121125/4790_1 /TAXON_ID=33640 /ORGANISM="Asterionellopsis glacialis, Strain CCMP134" /LENGTH=302 /DNA_ID=CAMNT_0040384221 /DNA_START=39 /DNA_END=947 /DNA_ORIENTATION=+
MSRNWLTDFKYEDGAWLVKKTGHRVPATRGLTNDIFTWLTFYTLAQSWRTWRRVTGHKRATIAFYPEKPRPWYFIWPVMHASGAKLISDPSIADIVFQFDDSTETDHEPPATKPGAKLVNFGCKDISKSNVAAAFERAAGYSLAVDPQTSEKNACHDGRILEGPIAPIADKTYQVLVDNEIDGGLIEDLRCCICGGEPAIVFRKRRPIGRRFLNENAEVLLDTPQNCYSEDEIRVISRFADEIGLEWGGVDVLRDNASGKIYIVDANKTDMGPPVALKLGDKLKSTRRMAKAFVAAFAPKRK